MSSVTLPPAACQAKSPSIGLCRANARFSCETPGLGARTGCTSCPLMWQIKISGPVCSVLWHFSIDSGLPRSVKHQMGILAVWRTPKIDMASSSSTRCPLALGRPLKGRYVPTKQPCAAYHESWHISNERCTQMLRRL